MSYSDFTLERVEADFKLNTRRAELFPDRPMLPVSPWLEETLARGRINPLVSEKARSEYIVAPILIAIQDAGTPNFAVFSGQRLDVDPARGLVGECDFILALTTPVPRLKSPIMAIVEAKRGDVELGLGQCAAQLVAARIFNERAGEGGRPLYGCVTSGDDWQFLCLDDDSILLDNRKLFINDPGAILAILAAIVAKAAKP